MAQPDARPTGDQAPVVQQHSFVEIDHEIFSTVIRSLPLIRGQFLAKEYAQVLISHIKD